MGRERPFWPLATRLGVPHSDSFHSPFDPAEEGTDEGEVLEEATRAVPEIVVKDDAAGGVEPELGHADGACRLAFAKGAPGDVHRPANVVITAFAQRLVNHDLDSRSPLGRLQEIGPDGTEADMRYECVVQDGVWRIDRCDFPFHPLWSQIAEKRPETLKRGGFLW